MPGIHISTVRTYFKRILVYALVLKGITKGCAYECTDTDQWLSLKFKEKIPQVKKGQKKIGWEYLYFISTYIFIDQEKSHSE